MRCLLTNLRVEFAHLPESDCCGQYFDHPTPTVQINTAYSEQVQIRTQVHEYFHALYRQVHDPDDDTITEEQAARLFELGVHDLVRHSWPLLQRLRGEE